jgi:hypothetical protein
MAVSLCPAQTKIVSISTRQTSDGAQLYPDANATRPVQRTERGEEPSVLAAGVSLLENLLDSLLGVLALRNLLEGIVGDGTLETLELESVASGHQVVVVDDLDEGLDLVSLLLAGLGHAAGDLGGVSLNAGNQGVAERVRLVAVVNGLDDDNL